MSCETISVLNALNVVDILRSANSHDKKKIVTENMYQEMSGVSKLWENPQIYEHSINFIFNWNHTIIPC